MKRTQGIAITGAVLAVLSMLGCYDSVDITWYEPGVYKGPQDPLTGKLKNSNLQKQLEDRLREIQTDR